MTNEYADGPIRDDDTPASNRRGSGLFVESEFIPHPPGKYLNLYRLGMVIPWEAKRRIYSGHEAVATPQKKPMLPVAEEGGGSGIAEGEPGDGTRAATPQSSEGKGDVRARSETDAPAKENPRSQSEPGQAVGSEMPLWKQLESVPERKRFKVINEATLDVLKDGGRSIEFDMRERNQKLFKQLISMGEYRRVGTLGKISDLDDLRRSHPHFGPVIDFVGNRLLMSQHSRVPQRVPPILLAGPPGVGKTHFCDALANVLGVPCRRHQMDQAETSSALLGSEKTWGNSSIGLVFDQVMLGEYANPIVILDELDKASVRTSHTSPAAVLHTLLEPVTASRVRDLSVDLEFDAGLITWVATANDPTRIPRTLLSRMKCFWIGMPNAEQAMLIVQSVAAHAVKDAGVPGFVTPSRALLSEIAHYSARQIYQIVSEVIARCVTQGRKHVELSDLERWVVKDDDDLQSKGGEGKEKVTLH